MKFSVNWLREFVDLPAQVEEVAEILTLAGVEIEGIEQRGAPVDKVTVAQIKASAPHPNADRLSVCQVDDGSGQTRQIVCGAKNYAVGDKVFLASPGAALPNGTKIKESKLRGVESQGMLCSAIELGLGEDAAGLLILSPDARIGASMSEIFSADTILDVEITPNRGDLLSHYGLAREIAALVGTPLRGARESGLSGETSLPVQKDGVKIDAPLQCLFFSLRRIENVQVGPSPAWLRGRLEAAGIRSINNVVDISNFVMLELGQPTHAFDADKIKGKIHVRLARAGEKFLALDGKNYLLTPHDLVVADDERAVGIAGVMGGEETGVTESTRNILLEAAYFLPAAVRRTARALSLPSDASYRFERGVDPKMVLPASQRATDLMREIAGGKEAKEILTGGRVPDDPGDVLLAYAKCDALLGMTLTPKAVDEILERFGLSQLPGKTVAKNSARWKVPSFRRDLQRDVDLIEEVVRAYGVNKIPGNYRSRFTAASVADRHHDFDSGLRERMVAQGITEARTSKLVPRRAVAFGENAVELKNPLSEDYVALRPTLISSLLGVLERNIRAGAERVAIFEIGRTFSPPDAKEETHVALLFWGKSNQASWRSMETRDFDFFDLKGAIAAIVPYSEELSFQRTAHADLAIAVEVRLTDEAIGRAGQLIGARAKELDATGAVLVAEMNCDPIFQRTKRPRFREIERFPSVTRDIALIVPEKISHHQILAAIETPREPLLESVALFDLFSGDQANNLGAARKSLAYRLTYRDRSRTLTNEEVTAAHAKIRERLQSELGAELRE